MPRSRPTTGCGSARRPPRCARRMRGCGCDCGCCAETPLERPRPSGFERVRSSRRTRTRTTHSYFGRPCLHPCSRKRSWTSRRPATIHHGATPWLRTVPSLSEKGSCLRFHSALFSASRWARFSQWSLATSTMTATRRPRLVAPRSPPRRSRPLRSHRRCTPPQAPPRPPPPQSPGRPRRASPQPWRPGRCSADPPFVLECQPPRPLP